MEKGMEKSNLLKQFKVLILKLTYNKYLSHISYKSQTEFLNYLELKYQKR